MTRRYISLIDPPIRLQAGDRLIDQHIKGEAPQYGRILFTEGPTLLEICEDVEISHCIFEHGNPAILIRS